MQSSTYVKIEGEEYGDNVEDMQKAPFPLDNEYVNYRIRNYKKKEKRNLQMANRLDTL